MLKQSYSFDKDIFPPLSSRVKLLANLDIAEKKTARWSFWGNHKQ